MFLKELPGARLAIRITWTTVDVKIIIYRWNLCKTLKPKVLFPNEWLLTSPHTRTSDACMRYMVAPASFHYNQSFGCYGSEANLSSLNVQMHNSIQNIDNQQLYNVTNAISTSQSLTRSFVTYIRRAYICISDVR